MSFLRLHQPWGEFGNMSWGVEYQLEFTGDGIPDDRSTLSMVSVIELFRFGQASGYFSMQGHHAIVQKKEERASRGDLTDLHTTGRMVNTSDYRVTVRTAEARGFGPPHSVLARQLVRFSCDRCGIGLPSTAGHGVMVSVKRSGFEISYEVISDGGRPPTYTVQITKVGAGVTLQTVDGLQTAEAGTMVGDSADQQRAVVQD